MCVERIADELDHVMEEVIHCFDCAIVALRDGRRVDAEKWLADARGKAEGLRIPKPLMNGSAR